MGVMAMIVVPLSRTIFPGFTPKYTLALLRPVPVIVTVVSPPASPMEGLNSVTVGWDEPSRAARTPFRIRSPSEEAIMRLQRYAAWLRFSPVVLAFQVLPTTETDTRIVIE